MVKVGTSGWSYPHWRCVFYPERLPQKRWLEFYARHFSTVEINSTFYGRPSASTLTKWVQSTPEGFLFSVKASRFITHIKRLQNVEDFLKRFYKDISLLKNKLGVLLFQLPPNLGFNRERLENFLSQLDPSLLHTIEVRHESFHCNEFFSLLRKHNVAFCISDTAGCYPSLDYQTTADFLYIRLHGSQALYASNYSHKELLKWATQLYPVLDRLFSVPKRACWLSPSGHPPQPPHNGRALWAFFCELRVHL